MNNFHKTVDPLNNNSHNAQTADTKTNIMLKEKKKLKGKRAVVRWLKFFRWKKKKDYQRMTAEEKILYKLRKARNKESRLMEALKKIEPPDSSEPIHDPEILTPEEHFYFLKMALKCKNYVPVGRRGIYQGVILNMHLHWKKHQILKVVVKTFTAEEVKEIAAELARLSGGIVLDIQEDNTIIMYRGKNYSQPPTEIMSPKTTLPRIKALNKSKYRDGLRAVRKFIPRLEQDLELLQEQAKRKQQIRNELINEKQEDEACDSKHGDIADQQKNLDNLKNGMDGNISLYEDSTTESGTISDSEGLSDIFETDTDEEVEEKAERPLYLDTFENFPSESNEEPEDFEEHLRQISLNSKKTNQPKKEVELPEIDELDRIFLRAGSLLRQTRR
ncbi:RNA-binding CRS1 / YhbY (CRM) domain protein [Thalictrum thalictroides]|uniref:RNA-binding CRS1 / YhbY (CRM) domain protein n=1 Tax=Thalictrum thalictroides TaxID=46969 RepID=A0A7J6V0K9_THATH|nr:RNA-binding CRS1 / YhbY (CRM) domain protein [Thalictrum thalictroides]